MRLAEAEMLEGAIGVQVEGHREGRFALARGEGRRLAEGAGQQGQPGPAQAKGFGLVAQPEIQGTTGAEPFGHGRGMDPEAQARVAVLEGHGRQDRRIRARPAAQHQGGQAGEILPVLVGNGLRAGAGRGGPVVQAVFGQEQVPIGFLAGMDRQAAGHVALGRQLGHRVAVHPHLHHRLLGGVEVHRIGGGQFQGGEQAIVEGNGHEAIVLLLHLGQQAGGLALQDALDAALGRAPPTALAGDTHQHPIPIPGVVELVVADIDVFFAVVAQGKTEALAAAAQAGLNQARVTAAADAVFAFFEHPSATKTREGDAEQVLVARVGEAKRFFELGDG